MEQNVYRLPLLSHATALSTLPGQPVDASYSLVKDLDQPKGGLGYVAQVVGRRKVRVLAWISEDMKVFPTAQTLASEPDGRGELHFDPWTDTPNSGAVRVQSSDGFDRTITIGEYAVDGGTAWLTACTEDLGAYREGKHPLAVLIAACWIGACLVPRLAGKTVGAGAGRISELFRDMMAKPLPDGLDEIIWRGTTNNAGQSSVFERFAARQLVEAGAGQIRQIEGEHPLSVIRLDSTDMFWMRFDDDETKDCSATWCLVWRLRSAACRSWTSTRVATTTAWALSPRSPRRSASNPPCARCTCGPRTRSSCSRRPRWRTRSRPCAARKRRAVAHGT